MSLILIVLIALFGALVRTIFGFGEALVTMPLLALVGFDIQTGTALIGALGLLVALPATIRFRAQIDFTVVRRLVLGSLLGVPIGISLIKLVARGIVLHLLGVFLLVYGSYSLYKSLRQHLGKPRLQANSWDYLAGMVSGALGSAYNSHGVPVVIYGTLKRWPVNQLRGILQAHFVCVGIIVVLSQAFSGFWSMQVVELLLIIIPLLFVVIPFGNWISDHIARATLVKYIYVLLIVFGGLLVLQ
ncbi:sulfite exporter TauE/SafE family protein [Paucilactobacillus wasatchensis]|uniref:Probable membrane transporter protein n=1 Tax=Paucilactobacillus wasatchensis TaxID=1335616 RepID=A0A0D1A7I8_9LACO|nr:sulfite exporter TauE/SafE family protein [Paucilactobacillus wasatchensis]KIS03845.1 Inner membrane protein [Paucilactobacillus wasatchensis]